MKTKKPELKIMTPKREPAPEWVWSTPWEAEYSLSMLNDGGEDTERIDLTREEYVSIKHHLARIRGYDLSSVMAKTDEDAIRRAAELTLPQPAPKKRKGA
jgi:hypothetical protein